ncbi:TcpQ domain-containing protein [Herbaspirillum seropedicae]|uniref:TcpQ domain-containing protein n=1 Tax=Herbaspirillum seropedicae TaxID=964 RepID=UPI0015DD8FB5|nr:TcpQ domain-containing protein [Herbaspirillum seropedicae]
MAACLPGHAQQAGEEPPASPRSSVWLPPGASLTPELAEGIGVSALGQQVDPGVQQWQVRRADISVRRMLQRWGQEAGWQLLWDVPRDFQIETELQLSGRIEQVVSAVVESLAITDFPVQARINSELRIIRIGSYLESKAR